MICKTDTARLDEIIAKYQIDEKIASLMKQSLSRINMIDESKTFRYLPLAKFERKLSTLNILKNKAIESFKPFADRYHTSLCAAMGFPMTESILRSRKTGNYEAVNELFGLTNIKAKKFGLAALYCAIDGQKNDIPDRYNIVFDRDSPWTYRNEAEHMEEYARYHFNSYVINNVVGIMPNPFEPVIELYEIGAADFIFMQTEHDGTTSERLVTFHTINIPGKGNVIAVHMSGDEDIVHYRRWGDPYFATSPVKKKTGLKIIGIADQRFNTG